MEARYKQAQAKPSQSQFRTPGDRDNVEQAVELVRRFGNGTAKRNLRDVWQDHAAGDPELGSVDLDFKVWGLVARQSTQNLRQFAQ
jgi:hypothetical protein